MARKTSTGEPEDEFPAPFTEETKPIETVDIDDAIEQAANPEAAKLGKRFFFGHVGLLKFEDGTQYHIAKQHATISDPKLIANIIKASEKPNSKIFLQDDPTP